MEIRPPVRVTHTYVQRLEGTPAEVLPLLCPVREMEWEPGWRPSAVYSSSGVAEPDCIFVTPDGEREAVWTILQHDAVSLTTEMLKVTPGFLVVRLHISLAAAPSGGTDATVRYTYTALGPEGEDYVHCRTPEAYAAFMQAWESALNAYLTTGRPRAGA